MSTRGEITCSPIDRRKTEMARRMRRAATPAERAAWRILRNRGVLGLKFRRQQIIEGFIVDFYCTEIRAALELDGDVHSQQVEYDALRDAVLANAGIRVIRVRNEDVGASFLEQLLLSTIAGVLLPSPGGRGDGGEVCVVRSDVAGRSSPEPSRSSPEENTDTRDSIATECIDVSPLEEAPDRF